jgi:molybdopterin-synthase adenylyltransferase
MAEHLLHPDITNPEHDDTPISIALIGAGGNGSRMLSGLRHLHHALEALDQRSLHVTVFDPDTVSESNLARQAFYRADIGLPKATILVNRLNIACGLAWDAMPQRFKSTYPDWDIVISCVDSRSARAEIEQVINAPKSSVTYWLDMGNDLETGQVCLGQPARAHTDHELVDDTLEVVQRKDPQQPRLPTAPELWPEIADTTIPEADAPSCSTLEALERQDLFVNELVTGFALNLLWRLLRHGKLEFHGGYINAATGISRPIPVPGGEA